MMLPTCLCGKCEKCKAREYSRRRYREQYRDPAWREKQSWNKKLYYLFGTSARDKVPPEFREMGRLSGTDERTAGKAIIGVHTGTSAYRAARNKYEEIMVKVRTGEDISAYQKKDDELIKAAHEEKWAKYVQYIEQKSKPPANGNNGTH